MFTAACVNERGRRYYRNLSRDTDGCLLFGRRSEPLDLEDRELQKEIAESEVTRELLGDDFIIIPYRNEVSTGWDTKKVSNVLIATTTAETICKRAIEQARGLPVTLVREGRISYQDGLEIVNACSLPHKYVVGCSECASPDPTDRVCSLVQLQGLEVPEFTIDDYINEVKYWRTCIGRFRAIGPSLTALKAIEPAARAINEHDFSCVSSNMQMRSDNAKEHVRIQKFRKEMCTQCAFRKPCIHESKPKRCYQPYLKNLDKIAKFVIANVQVPFTEHQIQTLLLNSGKLDRYVDSYKCFATFVVEDGVLYFALNRKTAPLDFLYKTTKYETAKKWLETYLKYPRFPDKMPRMPRQEKAALLELASRQCSPTYYNGWRSTSYPLWYIKRDIVGKLKTTYAWANGRAYLPWHVTVSDLLDIYQNYQHLNFADGDRLQQ